jgi:glycosyltransferase involved in cell wall biosynthesis
VSIRTKKIVLTATSDLTNDSRLIRICTTLSTSGYDVLLIGRRLKNSLPLNGLPYRQKRLRCLFNRTMLFYAEFNMRLLFRLLFTRADIIVANDYDTLPGATLAALLKGKRLVFDSHEYFTEVPELEGRGMVRRVWAAVGRLCIPRASLCYTVSESLAVELTRLYRKEFMVIRNVPLLDESPGERSSRTNPPILLYQGALNSGRCIEDYIECMNEIDGTLLIAGDGPLRKELEKLADTGKTGGKVVFRGRLSSNELSAVASEATIGLNVLSSNSKSYHYSLANKFFDYIHAELPQVCIDFPEYRLINEEWEVAVLCGNSREQIAEAVRKLLSDTGLYNRLRENCIAAARNLNWQNESKKLLALYADL